MKEIHRQLPLGRYQSMLNPLAVVLKDVRANCLCATLLRR